MGTSVLCAQGNRMGVVNGEDEEDLLHFQNDPPPAFTIMLPSPCKTQQ